MVSQWEIEDINGEVVSIFGVSKDQSCVLARLENNQLINVPVQLLEVQNSERYYLPRRFRDFLETSINTKETEQVIPVIEEKPILSKKQINTAEVKIRKHVKTQNETIEQSLAREEIQITRTNKNEVLTSPAEVRTEGDCTYIPVQEEILYVEKRYLVREEVCIRRLRTEHNEKVVVNLRKEDLTVERKKLN